MKRLSLFLLVSALIVAAAAGVRANENRRQYLPLVSGGNSGPIVNGRGTVRLIDPETPRYSWCEAQRRDCETRELNPGFDYPGPAAGAMIFTGQQDSATLFVFALEASADPNCDRSWPQVGVYCAVLSSGRLYIWSEPGSLPMALVDIHLTETPALPTSAPEDEP